MIAGFDRFERVVLRIAVVSFVARYRGVRCESGRKRKFGSTVRISTVRLFRPRWDNSYAR